MKNKIRLTGLLFMTVFLYKTVNGQVGYSAEQKKNVIINKWEPLKTVEENGLLGERIDLWRNNRLWYVANSDFLLSGFESRPGIHRWQGEHAGKWIHAATLAYERTKDEKLKVELHKTVKRLIASQLPNGYMGTYREDQRFYNSPTDSAGWDVWTDRYNLYGLLAFEKYNPDTQVLEVCKKEGDLLIEVYGKGKYDITKYGTRKGISSTTLLESFVMLYERTQDRKYLDFAERIVACSEANPGLSLMSAMLNNESVVDPGDGKAYQLMANLLGYFRLYQSTANEMYLNTVLKGWDQIQKNHTLITGGPWTRRMDYNANKECFAYKDAFNPYEIVVENCCTVTWMQLNFKLLQLTGMAKYAEEAEKTMFNQLLGGQHSEGIDWCYYTKPNETHPPYVSEMHCCASSGPRGLEIFSNHLVGKIGDRISVNSLSPSTIALNDQFGGGDLNIKSNFPFSTSAKIVFENNKEMSFPVEFRLPYGASLKRLKINGKKTDGKLNSRGYIELSNKWKRGDILSIDMNYKLQAQVQEGENDRKWIAFSYGPISLTQKITEKPAEEPFRGLKILLNNPEKFLRMLSKPQQSDSSLTFTIKNTGIKLIPYYMAGSRVSGPRTYFEVFE